MIVTITAEIPEDVVQEEINRDYGDDETPCTVRSLVEDLLRDRDYDDVLWEQGLFKPKVSWSIS